MNKKEKIKKLLDKIKKTNIIYIKFYDSRPRMSVEFNGSDVLLVSTRYIGTSNSFGSLEIEGINIDVDESDKKRIVSIVEEKYKEHEEYIINNRDKKTNGLLDKLLKQK